MIGHELGAPWPADEDLWLVIDPGGAGDVTLSPDVVRALPAMAPHE